MRGQLWGALQAAGASGGCKEGATCLQCVHILALLLHYLSFQLETCLCVHTAKAMRVQGLRSHCYPGSR